MRRSIRNASLTLVAATALAGIIGGTAQAAPSMVTVPPLTFSAPTALNAAAAPTTFTAHVEGLKAGLKDTWLAADFTGVDQGKVSLSYQDSKGVWQTLKPTVIGTKTEFVIPAFSIAPDAAADIPMMIQVASGAATANLGWSADLLTGKAPGDQVVAPVTGNIAVTTDVVAPRVSIATNAKTVVAGHAIQISGKVTDANHANKGIGGVTVNLRMIIPGVGAGLVDHTTADKNGNFVFKGTPDVTANYQATYSNYNSGTVNVAVDQWVTATPAHSKMYSWQHLVVKGSVGGQVKAHEKVYLQRLVGKTWKTYAWATVDSKGHYQFNVRMDSRKDYQWRVATTGGNDTGAGSSNAFKIVVY